MSDPTKQSIGQLIGALTPAQLIAMGTVAAGLISSSFGFGFWLGETRESTAHETTKRSLIAVEGLRETLEGDVARLEGNIEQMKGEAVYLQAKDKLLALLVQWHDAKAKVSGGDPNPGDVELFDRLSDALFNYVIDLDRSGLSGADNGAIDVRINKGSAPTVTFTRDGSSLPLPYELFATAE